MPTTRRGERAVGRRVDITGASGQRYAFTRLEPDSPLRAVGVTYVIAEPSNTGWQVIEAGETNDLAAGAWRASLDAVRSEHPKAECLVRLNVSRSIRVAEVEDINQMHAPPGPTV